MKSTTKALICLACIIPHSLLASGMGFNDEAPAPSANFAENYIYTGLFGGYSFNTVANNIPPTLSKGNPILGGRLGWQATALLGYEAGFDWLMKSKKSQVNILLADALMTFNFPFMDSGTMSIKAGMAYQDQRSKSSSLKSSSAFMPALGLHIGYWFSSAPSFGVDIDGMFTGSHSKGTSLIPARYIVTGGLDYRFEMS